MRYRWMGAALLAAVVGACSNGPTRDDDAARQEAAIPHEAKVTVYPVDLAGSPRVQVARVVAMMLERGGMENVEVSETAWKADAKGELADWSQEFGSFVKEQSPSTDYALVGAYVGSPQRGVDEVRGVLVDANGAVVWSDRQRKGDRDFDRIKPHNPMTCTMLLVERLKDPMALDDPFRKDAPKSRQEEAMRRDAGMPDAAERKEIEARAARFREAGADAKLTVFPVRIGNDYSAEEGQALAAAIRDAGTLDASASPTVQRFEAKGSMNQQKVLWSAARSIQARMQGRPVASDYVLFAHYVKTPMQDEPYNLHLFVLDAKGEIVLVDFQNSHQKDFQKIRPKTAADCRRLAVVRLGR